MKVKINSASVDEIVKLPGIGPVIARRIVQFRDENHFRYRKLEDLTNIKGITKGLAQTLEEFIDFDDRSDGIAPKRESKKKLGSEERKTLIPNVTAIITGVAAIISIIIAVTTGGLKEPIDSIKSFLFTGCPSKRVVEENIIVLVAKFENRGGENQEPQSYIIEKLSEQEFGEKIVIWESTEVIGTKLRAYQVGNRCKANYVIWGWYDINGISPHLDVLELPKELCGITDPILLKPKPVLNNGIEEYSSYVVNSLPSTFEYFLHGISGHFNFAQEEYDKAVDSFTKALTLEIPFEYSQDPDILFYMRGISNFRLKNFDQAVPDFKKALEINPNYIDSYQ